MRQALTRERTRAESLLRERATEVTRLAAELQATQAERVDVQRQLSIAQEQLALARVEISRLEEAVKQHQVRADEAEARLRNQAAHALTKEQFEQRLREVLSKTLHEKLTTKRRFTPGDKSGR